jgi:predicted MPP superfamily phosphohydrolase
MAQLLRDQGIDVLTNEHRVLQVRGQQVVIAGVDDPVTGHDDLTAALAGIAPDAVTVLLSHTPDLFPQVPAHVDLMLAGHTHCGQVTVPGLGRPMVPSHFGQRYAAGLVVEGGHQLYVTCGIGTAVMPVRFGNPPEVVVLTLH